MARKKDVGKKFRILFVTHSLTRIFRNLLFITVITLGLWWAAPYTPGFFRPPNDVYFIWAAILFLILMVAALFFRHYSIVQAQPRFILIRVPFFRLKIPYDMVENVRMVLFKDLYEKKKMTWSQRRFLSHYLPRTVVRINLTKYPMSRFMLSIFMPGYLLLPPGKGTGFVIYTKQYLELSTEIDSRLNVAHTAAPMGELPKRKAP
ncbi:MAG: hypothetical protein ACK2T7_03500, partial [Anaerolineales bacterium]